MAKRALYQATERILAVATDILHIGNSNKDYRISFANLCQYIWMYLTGTYFIEQAVKNISAGNQVTNLSIYEAGGVSEKPNGFRIKVAWTGGNKTYSHAWTGTGYKIGGLLIEKWVGYGFGELTLEIDKTNGNWKICEPSSHIWDQFTTATVSFFYQICKRSVNRKMTINIINEDTYTINDALGSGFYDNAKQLASITFAIAFLAPPILPAMPSAYVVGENTHVFVVGGDGNLLSATTSLSWRLARLTTSSGNTIKTVQTYEGTEA